MTTVSHDADPSSTTTGPWHRRAAALDPHGQAFVDGGWVDALSGATSTDSSPVDGRPIVEVAAGDAVDIDRAVGAARRAFDDGRWAMAAPKHRRLVLLDFAARIRAARADLAVLISRDAGRPVTAALGEVDGAADIVQFFAEAIDKTFGEVPPTVASALATVTREPIGVVGAVTPWNFPIGMPVWKIAPALSVGCSVVLKPAEQAPLVAVAMAELAAAAGVPDGVFNVVPGLGETAGRALGLHPDVDKIAFTGSTEVGRMFLQYSAASNLKSVSLECGGKSPNIVLADCPDLEVAAAHAALGGFVNQGQMCSAGSRLVVERPVYEQMLDALSRARQAWLPGDPYDPASKAGSIIDGEAMERIRGYIRTGVAEGATLAAGSADPSTPADGPRSQGHYLDPVIFADVDNGMRIAQEEIFGPVLSVIPADDPQQAVAIANDSPYGLAAAIWSSNVSTVHRLSRQLRAGTVWVNCYNQADVNVPFGGYKQSGFGRDKSFHALEQYTQLKTTWINLDV